MTGITVKELTPIQAYLEATFSQGQYGTITTAAHHFKKPERYMQRVYDGKIPPNRIIEGAMESWQARQAHAAAKERGPHADQD